MTEIISTRVPEDISRDLKEIEKEEKTDRATTVSTCSGTTFRRAECCLGTI
jgi:hypothetical protein